MKKNELKQKIKRGAKVLGFDVKHIPRIQGDDVAFLHIGKNAGTEITLLARDLRSQLDPIRIVSVGHNVKLRDIKTNSRYFFSLRDPVSRFYSGFYSRKFQGKPYYSNPWSAAEEYSFEKFEHANDLAESLSSGSKSQRDAFFAMLSIGHVNTFQSDWFVGVGDFLRIQPPVWIIRQENFNADMCTLLSKLSRDVGPRDVLENFSTRRSHGRSYRDFPKISEVGVANIKNWYFRDFLLLEYCNAWMSKDSG